MQDAASQLAPESASSYQTDDTMPNTPNAWVSAVNASHNGDFARVWPLSELAKEAFMTVSSRIQLDPSWASNARRFITVDDAGAGYYRLAMSTTPLSLSAGWVIGTDVSAVDILLVDPESELAATTRVAHRHCQIAFGPESDALLLRSQPGREVIVNGCEVIKFDPRMLARQTGLQIGTLSYIFDYTPDFPQALFRKQLDEMRALRGWPNPELLPALTPTPGPDAITYRGFHIEKASLYGASAMVSFGRRISDSRPVVAKRLKVPKSRSAIAAARNEINNLQCLRHNCIVRLAEGFSPDLAVFGDFETQMLEVILIMEPAMPQTMADMIQTGQGSFEEALYLLRDVVSAVVWLHSYGYMHHDLKPANIGVSPNRKPPKAVLLDLGHTRIAETSRDHMLGTISYLAPEVIALKRDPSAQAFDHRADVWSVGLTFAELLLRNPVSTRWRVEGISSETYDRLLQWLSVGKSKAVLLQESGEPGNALYSIIENMLMWETWRRVESARAWENIKRAVQDLEAARDVANRSKMRPSSDSSPSDVEIAEDGEDDETDDEADDDEEDQEEYDDDEDEDDHRETKRPRR